MFSSCIVLSSRVPCRRMTTRLRSSDDGRTNRDVARSSSTMTAAAPVEIGRHDRRRLGLGTTSAWWRDAVIYELYVRSFADGNGDGIGDLAGVRSRLPYLASLGIDAIWFTPWYRVAAGRRRLRHRGLPRDRPGVRHARRGRAADRRGGRARDPDHRRRRPQSRFRPAPLVPGRARVSSRLCRASAVLVPPRSRSARRRDARPAGRPTSPARRGRAPRNPDGTPGEWYLHLFSAAQPDLNWDHPDVRREHEEILRFWLDRGAAGIRIDSAALLVKDPTLPEIPSEPAAGRASRTPTATSCTTSIAAGERSPTSYPGTRILVGELWLPDVERFAKYLRPDELHTAFNFDFMARPWDAREHARLDRRDARRARAGRRAGDLAHLEPRRDPAGHPLRAGGHVVRLRRASAAGRRPTSRSGGVGHGPQPSWSPPCPARSTSTRATSSGSRRSRTCPSTSSRTRCTSAPAAPIPGRDGCRVPLPWSGDERPFGFSPAGASAEPWLRQPATWAARTVDVAARRSGLDAQPVSRRAAHPPARAAISATARCAGSTRRTASWRSPGATASSPSRTSRGDPVDAARPRATPCSWPAPTLDDGRLPPDASAWLRIDPDTLARSPGWPTREAE